jgi:hypothetical protein
MVESVVEVFVKEERRPETIQAAVPPPISLWRCLQTLCFSAFDLHLCPSQKRIPEGIYRRF